MISNKSIKLLSITFLIGFIIIKIFGKYIILPFWDYLYTVDFNLIDLKTHLLISVDSLISLIVPICYAIFLFKYSKLFDKNPIFWATLGFIKGSFVIVLFLLTLIINGSKGLDNFTLNLKSKYRNIILWTFWLIILGIVFGLITKIMLTPLYTRIFDAETYSQYIMLTRTDQTTVLIYKFLINIGIAIWINKATKEENLNPTLWTLFGLIGGFIAPVLFYIYKFIDIKNEFNTTANTRS
jgi:hypothetical protein